MADDMTEMWKNFSLTEEEDVDVEVQSEVFEETMAQGQTRAVGKLLADRYVGKETIRSAMIGLWRPTGHLGFKVLGTNIFLIEFQYSWDKSRVLEGRPWLFQGHVFSVEEFDGRTLPSKIAFEKVSFWVRMFNLPLACMCQRIGYQLGAAMGEVEDVEMNEDGFGWGEYLRVRIKLDLSKPIPRGHKLKIQGETTWVYFKYERLPRLCFLYGLIQHGGRGCEKRQGPNKQGSETQFGPWLRVPSPTKKRTIPPRETTSLYEYVSTGGGNSKQGANQRSPTSGGDTPRRQRPGERGESDSVTAGSKALFGESARSSDLQTDSVGRKIERMKESAKNKGGSRILGEQMETDMAIIDKQQYLKKVDKILSMKGQRCDELVAEGENGQEGFRPYTHVGPGKSSRQGSKEPSPYLRKTWKRRAREDKRPK
jgi:hypothetical protein